MMKRRLSILLLIASALPAAAAFAAPVKSGLGAGDRLMPFTSNVLTGAFRGQQHCYVCDLGEEPAVLVFSRRQDQHTAKLMRELKEKVREHQKAKLFTLFVFIGEEDIAAETALEASVYRFTRENECTTLPVSALGDPNGPPGYRIASDAAITVLLARNKRVIFNHAYTAEAWNGRAVDAILKDVNRLVNQPAPAAR